MKSFRPLFYMNVQEFYSSTSERIDGSTQSTFSAHVSHMDDTIHTVAFEAFLDGVFQFRALTSDGPWYNMLRDDGTLGDPNAGDGYYTNQTVRVDLPETTPLEDYTIRISAVNEDLDQVTLVDASPLSIVEAFTPTGSRNTFPDPGYHLRNRPNPFPGLTTIEYTLPEACRVQVRIYNILGMEVATLADGPMVAGDHSHLWNAAHLQPGLYVCKIQAGILIQTLKLQLE